MHGDEFHFLVWPVDAAWQLEGIEWEKRESERCRGSRAKHELTNTRKM